MRIALLTDWFPPRLGGVESQLRELSTRLVAAGNDVTVLTTTPGAKDLPGVRVVSLDVPRLPSPPVAISPTLVPAIRRELERGWDVVHAHVSVVSPVGWSGALIARLMELPVALTFHSILRGKAILLKAVSALTTLGASRIAWSAVSGTVARQAAWALGAGEVHVLPNGIPLTEWQPATPGVTGTQRTLVSAMRLHRKKRGHALLRCFGHAARAAGVDARLVIVGAGEEAGSLRKEIARRGLDRGPARAEVRPWQTPAELRNLYAGADGFVMASVHESFGIAALEARAAGLPVIARVSGVTEFLTDGQDALLAANDAELTAHLLDFLSDAALRDRLARARPDLRRFDWGNVIADHLREYDRATRLAAIPAPAVARSG